MRKPDIILYLGDPVPVELQWVLLVLLLVAPVPHHLNKYRKFDEFM
jgi:hypothetical protein